MSPSTISGLGSPGRTWWTELSSALQELGFKRCENDWGLYVLLNDQGHPQVLLLAYVDDLLVASRDQATARRVLDALGARWTLTILGKQIISWVSR